MCMRVCMCACVCEYVCVFICVATGRIDDVMQYGVSKETTVNT